MEKIRPALSAILQLVRKRYWKHWVAFLVALVLGTFLTVALTKKSSQKPQLPQKETEGVARDSEFFIPEGAKIATDITQHDFKPRHRQQHQGKNGLGVECR